MRTASIPHRLLAIVICAALAGGCAGSRTAPVTSPSSDAPVSEAVLADYLKTLRTGAMVRVERTNGRTLRATLLKATERSVIVQTRTRIPEPAVEIPLSEVLRVTPETSKGHSVGRAVGVGVAVGAGAALAFFLVVAAIFAGS